MTSSCNRSKKRWLYKVKGERGIVFNAPRFSVSKKKKIVPSHTCVPRGVDSSQKIHLYLYQKDENFIGGGGVITSQGTYCSWLLVSTHYQQLYMWVQGEQHDLFITENKSWMIWQNHTSLFDFPLKSVYWRCSTKTIQQNVKATALRESCINQPCCQLWKTI